MSSPVVRSPDYPLWLGGFCRNCEFEECGRSIERSSQAERTCLVCERDGHFGLATWAPTLKRDGRRLVSEAILRRAATPPP